MTVNLDAYYKTQLALIERGDDLPEMSQAILLMMAAFSDDKGVCSPCDVPMDDIIEMLPILSRDLNRHPEDILWLWDEVVTNARGTDA
jgi:hypothetical protein